MERAWDVEVDVVVIDAEGDLCVPKVVSFGKVVVRVLSVTEDAEGEGDV